MIIDHANGKQAFSPAIDIPVDYVTPSVLHIFLGVVADFFRKIESLGKKLIRRKFYWTISSACYVLMELNVNLGIWSLTV